MKKLLTLILIISILSSCNQKKSSKNQSELRSKPESEAEMISEQNEEFDTIQSEKQKDTVHNYWDLILDTISSKKEFKISDLKLTLKLKTYSLNDSSMVRNLAQKGERAYLDHSHKMVTDFKLITDSIIDTKRIDRTNFEKTLIPEFYSKCNLMKTEIDNIVGNIVYLNSSLSVPDTSNAWGVWYSFKIDNGRIGELKIKETDYIGM